LPQHYVQALFIGEMTELAHSLGKPVIVISTVLPYDLAAYTSADALIASYSSKKMTVIPEDYNRELAAYGPNYPAFGAFEPCGKLPVDIYAVDDDHKFTDEVLFPLGFGMSYGSSDDMTADEDTAEEDVAQPAETEVSADETPADEPAADGEATSVPSTGNIPACAAAASMVLGAAGAAAFKTRRKM